MSDIDRIERIVNEAARVDTPYPSVAVAVAEVTDVLFHGRPGAPIPRGIIYAGPSRRERLERSLSIAVARRLGFNRE